MSVVVVVFRYDIGVIQFVWLQVYFEVEVIVVVGLRKCVCLFIGNCRFYFLYDCILYGFDWVLKEELIWCVVIGVLGAGQGRDVVLFFCLEGCVFNVLLR